MASVTVRNLPHETHRALPARAAVRPEEPIKLGSLLAEIGREAGGVELEIERDRTPADPMSFE